MHFETKNTLKSNRNHTSKHEHIYIKKKNKYKFKREDNYIIISRLT
jgi:hypothetical protein